MTLPADMIGAWARPAPPPAPDEHLIGTLEKGRHRASAPVRLTRRGKVLAWIVAGLVSLAAWSGLAWAVWGLK